jgi:hypothetical protein
MNGFLLFLQSIVTGPGTPATTAGMATVMSGFPEPMSGHPVPGRVGFQAAGSKGVEGGSGWKDIGAEPFAVIFTRRPNVEVRRGIIIE